MMGDDDGDEDDDDDDDQTKKPSHSRTIIGYISFLQCRTHT